MRDGLYVVSNPEGGIATFYPASTVLGAEPRRLIEADLSVLDRLRDGVAGLSDERYRADLAAGRCRPEWSWVAEAEGRVVARAVWWGLPDSDQPLALECLQVEQSATNKVSLAAALVRAGIAALTAGGLTAVPAYTLVLPADWRDRAAAAAAVEWRREVMASVGLTEELERLRFEWTDDSVTPAPTTRVVLSPEADDGVMLEVFRLVAGGSLDVETRRGVEARGAEEQAREDIAFYRSMPGERSWWRVAHTLDGELVGVAVPSRSAYGPNVGYLGVVPAQRGRGYVDDLLAEITRFHADRGATRVTGTTDVTNAPMAAAFARAAYRNTEVRLEFSSPSA